MFKRNKQDSGVAVQEQVRAGEKIVWSPSPIKERGIVALPEGTTGTVTLGWGDNKFTDTSGAIAVSHVYSSGGAYKLTAYQEAEPGAQDVVYLDHKPDVAMALVAEQQVFVRNGLKPTVTFAAASDNPNIIEATFNDDPADLASKYQVTWNEGATPVTFFAPKGTVKSQGYQAGDHTITVRDLHTRRVLTETVTVVDPVYDPDFSVAQGANTMTATLTITNLGTEKAILVDWGDGAQTTLPTPKLNDTVSHEYLDADTFIVQCVYADGSTDGSARVVTVPFAAMASGGR